MAKRKTTKKPAKEQLDLEAIKKAHEEFMSHVTTYKSCGVDCVQYTCDDGYRITICNSYNTYPKATLYTMLEKQVKESIHYTHA